MPDDTFDVVVIGGGTKALFLSMYLTKYGDKWLKLRKLWLSDELQRIQMDMIFNPAQEPDSFVEQWKIINQKIKEIPGREA